MSSDEPNTKPSLEVADRVRLMRDGLVQNVAIVVSGVVGIVIVPILLHRLGVAAYGAWLTAASIAALFSSVDLGLGMTITREVAAAEDDVDAGRFVASAGTLYAVIGCTAMAVTAGAGLAVRGALHVEGQLSSSIPWVFFLTGVGVLIDTITAFTSAVLAGLRRYSTSSALTIAAVLTRAVGIVLLLRLSGTGVVTVIVWQTAIAFVFAVVGIVIVWCVAPAFAFRVGRFEWLVVKPRIGFALANQGANVANAALWRVPSILVGIICGAAWVTPLSISQRLPVVLELMLWRLSDVLLPSITARAADRDYIAEVFAVGTRWTLLLSVPVCVTLFLLAPDVLRAWVGEATPATTTVFRLTTVAILLEGVVHSAESVLWGAGQTRSELVVTVGRAVVVVLLSCATIPLFGIVGAAVAIVIGIAAGSIVGLRFASRYCNAPIRTVVRDGIRGLTVPVAASGAVAWATARFLPVHHWVLIGCSVGAAAVTYLALLAIGPIRPEERALARELLRLPLVLLRGRGAKRRE